MVLGKWNCQRLKECLWRFMILALRLWAVELQLLTHSSSTLPLHFLQSLGLCSWFFVSEPTETRHEPTRITKPSLRNCTHPSYLYSPDQPCMHSKAFDTCARSHFQCSLAKKNSYLATHGQAVGKSYSSHLLDVRSQLGSIFAEASLARAQTHGGS